MRHLAECLRKVLTAWKDNVRLSALKCCQNHSGHLIALRKMAKTHKQGVKFAPT